MTILNARDFGARGDGLTNDTVAIQQAIDTCAESGGTVVVPAGGTYRCGSLRLRSHVELHIERGATLQASERDEDYNEYLTPTMPTGTAIDNSTANSIFISARDAEHVAITGGGVIDGGGRFFVVEDTPWIYRCAERRPFTVCLLGCRNVTMRDVLIRDGAFWAVRFTGCEDVVVNGIRIDTDLKMPNGDGINVDRCRNVRISDCDISSGDDCISLKTAEEFPEFGPCENVVVSNCTLRSTSSALVVGVDATAPIRNAVFDNCVVYASNRGLSVNLGQDAPFENIIFSNIIVETRLFHEQWWGQGEPIYVSAVPWVDRVSTIRNVRFSNILARSENGVFVYGSEPGLVSGIVFDNVRVELHKWSRWPGGQQDLRPCIDMVVRDHPTSGFYLETASDVTLRNCEVVWGDNPPDSFAHAIESVAVDGLRLESFRGGAAHDGDATLLVDGRGYVDVDVFHTR